MIAPDRRALLARGAALRENGYAAEAQSVLSEAVLLDPACPDGHFLLGLALREGLLGTPAVMRARDEFAAAAHLREEWPQAWLELGRASMWLGDLSPATQAFRRAIALDDAQAEAWYLLYACLAESDAYEEALHALERACALAPESSEYARQREHARSLASKPRRVLGRFPLKASAFADMRSAIERYILPEMGSAPPFLSRESRVFTLGSCFARNIAIGLRKLGVRAEHAEQAEDVHSTYANRFFFEWLLGVANAHAPVFDRVFGEAYRERNARLLREANVIVYSLGVSACFFDRRTREPVMTLGVDQNVALQSEKFLFRTISVTENTENLLRIAELIESVNPHAMLVTTVSPVPLRASLEHGSAVVADCLSKSTLRVAAEEFLGRTRLRALYWPSFEIVRWMGAYTEPLFGAEDGSAFHVNQAVVDEVLRAFIGRFGDAGLREGVIAWKPEQAPPLVPPRA